MEEPNAKALGSWTCPDRDRFLMPAILAGLPLKDLLYQSTLYCSSGFTFHCSSLPSSHIIIPYSLPQSKVSVPVTRPFHKLKPATPVPSVLPSLASTSTAPLPKE
jgi:hypothetical protein